MGDGLPPKGDDAGEARLVVGVGDLAGRRVGDGTLVAFSGVGFTGLRPGSAVPASIDSAGISGDGAEVSANGGMCVAASPSVMLTRCVHGPLPEELAASNPR